MAHSIVTFLDLHPWAWPFAIAVAWAVFSGLLTAILDRWLPRSDEQWADLFARRPRVAALASLLKTAGFNLPGLVRSLRAFLAGPPPTLTRPSSRDPAQIARQLAAALGKEIQVKVLEDDQVIEAAPAPGPK